MFFGSAFTETGPSNLSGKRKKKLKKEVVNKIGVLIDEEGLLIQVRGKESFCCCCVGEAGVRGVAGQRWVRW